jgi:hypothetical protein
VKGESRNINVRKERGKIKLEKGYRTERNSGYRQRQKNMERTRGGGGGEI